MTDLYREENVLVIEKGLFAKRFTYSAEECKRHLLAGDYSALKECPFVLGGMEDIDGALVGGASLEPASFMDIVNY